MDNQISKIERFNVFNSLSCVPYLLLNHNTMIDLRNETSVAGTVLDVDGYNITH